MRNANDIRDELQELNEPLIPPSLPTSNAKLSWLKNREIEKSNRRQEIQIELLLNIRKSLVGQ